MREIKVNLTKRIQTAEGRKFFPVAYGEKGKIRPNYVMVNVAGKGEVPVWKQQVRAETGTYYLDWKLNGQRYRIALGSMGATEAEQARETKQKELNGYVPIGAPQPGTEGIKTVRQAVDEFIEETKLKQQVNRGLAQSGRGNHSTLGCYKTALEYFQESCSKVYLRDVDRHDLLRYAVYVKQKKGRKGKPAADVSVYNKFLIVVMFLKSHGITNLVKPSDWPRFTPKAVEVYEQDELDKLFAACDEDERLWFEFCMMTRFRKQEVMFCYKDDVNLAASTVSVTKKPEIGWVPKAYQERTVNLTPSLAAKLEAHIAKSDPRSKFLFPTSGGKPKRDFLDVLKSVAKKAGLDPARFKIKTFRSSFCTKAHAKGFTLPDTMVMAGHTQVETAMRYQKAANLRSPENVRKFNEMWGE
jgi:integrase